MGNCCLEHSNHNHHLPNQQTYSLPPTHHNPTLIYQQLSNPQCPHQQINIKTIDNSQIVSSPHQKDTFVTHQTTNNSILIPQRPKSNLTASFNHQLLITKEQANSYTSIVVPFNNTMTDKQLIELQQKQQLFLNSSHLFHCLNKSTDIPTLLQLAEQANQLHLHLQQKSLYMRCISHIDLPKNKFTHSSIQSVKAHIYRQLTKISINQANQVQADTFMLRAIQSYRQAANPNTIQQHIQLINNYAVFKVQRNRLEQGKKYLLMAIQLMNKYYSVEDDRRYIAMTNLACIEYDRHHYHTAYSIMSMIGRQCRNQQIRRLAAANQLYQEQPPQS